MVTVQLLSQRYIWFGSMHVMTGAFLLTIFNLLFDCVAITMYSMWRPLTQGQWQNSPINYLSFMTYIQWEQLASDIYQPQHFISQLSTPYKNKFENFSIISYGTKEKLTNIEPSMLNLLSNQNLFVVNTITIILAFVATMIFLFGLIARVAIFLLPYLFLQSTDLAFTIISVVLHIFVAPDLVLCLRNMIVLPYVVAVIGLLIVACKWVLFILTLSCFEYLAIFEEFGYIFEDSLVSRLTGNFTNAIQRRPRFRVRSVTFNAYPNANPPAFDEVIGQHSRLNSDNPGPVT